MNLHKRRDIEPTEEFPPWARDIAHCRCACIILGLSGKAEALIFQGFRLLLFKIYLQNLFIYVIFTYQSGYIFVVE